MGEGALYGSEALRALSARIGHPFTSVGIWNSQAAGDAEVVANMVEEEERPVSKYAEDLPVVDNGVKISPDPSKWECAESGMKENLWLNLSTGHIGSG